MQQRFRKWSSWSSWNTRDFKKIFWRRKRLRRKEEPSTKDWRRGGAGRTPWTPPPSGKIFVNNLTAENICQQLNNCNICPNNWWYLPKSLYNRPGINLKPLLSIRLDSGSHLDSMDSNIHLPTLSLHCHCQQLRMDGGGGEDGGEEGGEGGGAGVEEDFATISLSSTERLIEI